MRSNDQRLFGQMVVDIGYTARQESSSSPCVDWSFLHARRSMRDYRGFS